MGNAVRTKYLAIKAAMQGDEDQNTIITSLDVRVVKFHDMVIVVRFLSLKFPSFVFSIIKEKRTLLHHAAGFGRAALIRSLVQAGADINARDHRGWTPLYLACVMGQKELAIDLISVGADVEAKDMYGTTPLHVACEGNAELATALVSIGANPKVKVRKQHFVS